MLVSARVPVPTKAWRCWRSIFTEHIIANVLCQCVFGFLDLFPRVSLMNHEQSLLHPLQECITLLLHKLYSNLGKATYLPFNGKAEFQ